MSALLERIASESTQRWEEVQSGYSERKIAWKEVKKTIVSTGNLTPRWADKSREVAAHSQIERGNTKK